MTLLSGKSTISNRCISGLMPNLIKISWTDSTEELPQRGWWIFVKRIFLCSLQPAHRSVLQTKVHFFHLLVGSYLFCFRSSFFFLVCLSKGYWNSKHIFNIVIWTKMVTQTFRWCTQILSLFFCLYDWSSFHPSQSCIFVCLFYAKNLHEK